MNVGFHEGMDFYTRTWFWCSIPKSIRRSNPHLNRDGASLAFGVTNSQRPFKTEIHTGAGK
jgi:hypothetical protein